MKPFCFFDFRWSSDESCGSPQGNIFLGVGEDLMSVAHFWIITNENCTEYSSNVILLYTNYINKYILTVSPKKIIVNMLFYSEPPPSLLKQPEFRLKHYFMDKQLEISVIFTSFFLELLENLFKITRILVQITRK